MSRLALITLLFVAACNPDPTTVAEGAPSEDLGEATESVNSIKRGEVVANQYIVVLNSEGLLAGDQEGVRTEANTLVSSGSVRRVFASALHGFSAELSDSEARSLANDARVVSVEPNRAVYALATQSGATWGIDRLDAVNGTDGKYSYDADGSGVTAYIVDTGIRITHEDLGGRASLGFSAIDDGKGAADCHGHGTHVSGTVGGTKYGVAKNVKLVAVRVLDCKGSGTDEGVIAGIDWVAQNAQGPSVVNMSLGGDASEALDTAIRNAIGKGITFALAAGNESQDACNVSPARVKEAITVGATNKYDYRGFYSNTGTCVDLFAPGSSITSLNGSSDTGTTSMSGTSMASPHVAGAAALYLSKHPSASPQEVADALVSGSVAEQVKWKGNDSPDLLLNISFIK